MGLAGRLVGISDRLKARCAVEDYDRCAKLAARPMRSWWRQVGRWWFWTLLVFCGLCFLLALLQVCGLGTLLPVPINRLISRLCISDAYLLMLLLGFAAAQSCYQLFELLSRDSPVLLSRSVGHAVFWLMLRFAAPLISWQALISIACYGCVTIRSQQAKGYDWLGGLDHTIALQVTALLIACLGGVTRVGFAACAAVLFRNWRAVWILLLLTALLELCLDTYGALVLPALRSLGITRTAHRLLIIDNASPLLKDLGSAATAFGLWGLLVYAWWRRSKSLARAAYVVAIACLLLQLSEFTVPTAGKPYASPATNVLLGMSCWTDLVGSSFAGYHYPLSGDPKKYTPAVLKFCNIDIHWHPLAEVAFALVVNGLYTMLVLSILAWLVGLEFQRRSSAISDPP